MTSAPGQTAPALRIHAQILGYAGALPVWIFAIGVLYDNGLAEHLGVVIAYVATVFAFLGGIAWGFACAQPAADPRRLYVGVIPPLVATTALLIGPFAGASLLAVGIGVYLAYDHANPSAVQPDWYLRLRQRLSALLAVGTLLAAMLA